MSSFRHRSDTVQTLFRAHYWTQTFAEKTSIQSFMNFDIKIYRVKSKTLYFHLSDRLVLYRVWANLCRIESRDQRSHRRLNLLTRICFLSVLSLLLLSSLLSPLLLLKNTLGSLWAQFRPPLATTIISSVSLIVTSLLFSADPSMPLKAQ